MARKPTRKPAPAKKPKQAKLQTKKPANPPLNGLPRSAKEIALHKFRKIDIDFSSMTPEEKAQWIPFNAMRKGDIALVRPPSASNFSATAGLPTKAMPTGRGTYIVCTYNPKSTNFDVDCHEVPASEIGSHLEAAGE